jgi:hypothetical protein
MLKRYRAHQEAQLHWIQKHPVQYVALNAALIVAFLGYIEYTERRDERKFETMKAATK